LVTRVREVRTKLEGLALGSGHDEGVIAWPNQSADIQAAGNTASSGATALAAVAFPKSEPSPAEFRTQLSALEVELSGLQGEEGLIRVCVDAQIIGEVISGWTGIAVGKMMND